MSKLRLPSFGTDPERFEHFVLQLRLIDSHAAAADLHAVQNDVIGLGANLRKFFRFKQPHVLRFGTRERIMHPVPLVFLRPPFNKREVCDPEKIPLRRLRVRAGLAVSSTTKQMLRSEEHTSELQSHSFIS